MTTTSMFVTDYEESEDQFIVQVMHMGAEIAATIPACLFPKLTGESDEPQAFIGRTFEIA